MQSREGMKEQPQTPHMESRWPAGLAILTVLFLLEVLPGRIRLLPRWVPYLVAISTLVPMVAVTLTTGKVRWLRAERTVTLLFFVVASAATMASLTNLIHAMVRRSAQLTGIQLLASSIGIWVTNILAFSLLYWQIDREGPERRLHDTTVKPDWLFPQEGVPDSVRPGWHPGFVDYLFLGFSTATAFSTTDAVPLTSRAEILMMIESSISLVTLVVVAARAINILGP
jgi:hypothetical protein